MVNIKRMIARLLAPRRVDFSDNFETAFIQAAKETSCFDKSIRSIAQTWLVVCPYIYFSELFLERELEWSISPGF